MKTTGYVGLEIRKKVWIENKSENDQRIGRAEARHLEECAHKGICNMRGDLISR